ncbi:hypothetical protein [Streptomyces sp. NPDC014733]|uniref:hypothetical protein n=1 Tax=Streptomyces sp. NPDC014733 TaxID=3364885 RepID=UPI0036FB2CF2
MSRNGRLRRPAAGALSAVAALTLAGCGVRGTTVPVDAGGAPSRISCEVREPGAAERAPGRIPATVFLVCSGTLVPVTRTVPHTADRPAATAPLRAARVLLEELRRPPSPREEEAGFASAVPEDLTVAPARPGDPGGTLRLSVPPDALPSFALAQLACTFGDSRALGHHRAAVLGGPDDSDPHRYACTADVRAHPDAGRDTVEETPIVP